MTGSAPTGEHTPTPVRAALTLAGGAVLAVALLISVAEVTAPAIERSRAALLERQLGELLPPAMRATEPFADALALPVETPTGVQPVIEGRTVIERVILPRPLTRPPLAVLDTVARDGYNGAIRLLVAVRGAGSLLGVRVVEHRETPGLGDAIESQRSSWIRQFVSRPESELSTTPGELDSTQWQWRRRGGHFDHITGATITSKAVLQSVYDTLHWYHEHKERLIAAAEAAELARSDASATSTTPLLRPATTD